MKNQQYEKLKYVFLSLLIFLFFTGLQSQFASVGSGNYTTVFPGVDIAGRNGYP